MCNPVWILLLATIFNLTSGQPTYKAAVVEYAPFENSLDGETIAKENAKHFKVHIEDAKNQGAEIVIFPEYGLTTLPRKELKLLATLVPDPEEQIAPYQHKNKYSEVLMDLSAFVASKKIYTVVNLVEKDKDNNNILYNTNVAFDRDGKVIAKYRKINPFEEPDITAGNKMVTFKTDFGVTFGMFICFDIAFKNPAVDITSDVANIIFSTAWFSETPFIAGISVQAGYARANGVNLLASGLTRPANHNGGAGIYRANGTVDVSIPSASLSRLVVGEVPNIARTKFVKNYPKSLSPKPKRPLPTVDGFKTITENMTGYDYIFGDLDLASTEPQSVEVCQEDSCCKFVISFRKNPASVVYKVAIRSGLRWYGHQQNYIRTCGLVACRNGENFSCGGRIKAAGDVVFESISIKATHPKSEGAFYFPTTLLLNLDVIPNSEYSYEVTEIGDKVVIEMATNEPQDSLVGFGIYGRDDTVTIP